MGILDSNKEFRLKRKNEYSIIITTPYDDYTIDVPDKESLEKYRNEIFEAVKNYTNINNFVGLYDDDETFVYVKVSDIRSIECCRKEK